jgi:hypothetical protein
MLAGQSPYGAGAFEPHPLEIHRRAVWVAWVAECAPDGPSVAFDAVPALCMCDRLGPLCGTRIGGKGEDVFVGEFLRHGAKLVENGELKWRMEPMIFFAEHLF